jgi:hypothetical protein
LVRVKKSDLNNAISQQCQAIGFEQKSQTVVEKLALMG